MPTGMATLNGENMRSAGQVEVAFLLLDGLRRPRRAHPQEVVLCAVGLSSDWNPHPLAMRLASCEDELAWRILLNDLKAAGVGDALLISCDGHPALMRAIQAAYPDVPIQISVSHELLALSRKVDSRWRAACMAEARQIFSAPDRAIAISRFRIWRDRWLKQGERAVVSLEADLASCLTFYRFPTQLWSKIRTVNLVERVFRQTRQAALPVALEPMRAEPMQDPQPMRDLESAGGAEQTVQAGPLPQAELTGEDGAGREGTRAAVAPEQVATMPEPEILPSPDGHHHLPPAQGVNLSADADFMWWLKRHRQTRARRIRVLVAVMISVVGLMTGVVLSRGL